MVLIAGLVTAALALSALAWLAARLWWIIGTLGAAVALAVAAVWWLIRRQQRREALYAVRRRSVTARVVTQMAAESRPQITPVIIQNFYGPDAAIAAASLIQASARGEVTPVSSNDDAAAKARADQRQAERDARLATGRAQPLGGDRPQDRQARDNADQN